MRRGTLAWLWKAVRDRSRVAAEKPVHDVGALTWRAGVGLARRLGVLSRPVAGEGILVINLTSHFGDGVMLLPMLEAIHRNNPATPIDLACSRGVDGLFRAVPFLRRVYAAPLSAAPPLTLRQAVSRRLAILRWYRAEMKDVHPRWCLMPRWGDDLFGSVYLAHLIGAPERVGYRSTVDQIQRSAPGRDRLLTYTVEGGQGMHEPLRFVRVAKVSGLISEDVEVRTDVPSVALRMVAESVPWEPLRTRLGLPESGFVVLAPCASQPHKTWPEDRWIAAGQALRQAGYELVLLAGAGDRAAVERVAAGLGDEGVSVVAGGTSLAESVAVMAHAEGFLGNDSGPGHAAGALGLPTVILFSSGPEVSPDNSFSPQRIRPMGPQVRALQPEQLLEGCRQACIAPLSHCIATIPVEAAVGALLEMIRVKAAA